MQPAPEIDPLKVAVYVRWSTDDQGQGTTLDTQMEKCKQLLVLQGWTFQERLLYIDDGYSGGNLDRPAMSRLRSDVKAGLVQCVVFYKLDRLSRSVLDTVDLVLKEWEGRCWIKSTTEDINTMTPTGKTFFYLLVSFAEYERNMIRERTLSGKIRRAKEGKNPGFKLPYGYRRGDTSGSMVIHEKEARVVRLIFGLVDSGFGITRVQKELAKRKILSSSGAEYWSHTSVLDVVRNPAYKGTLEYGRTVRITKAQQDRDKSGPQIRTDHRHAVVVDAFPVIIDVELWQRVNSTRTEKPRTKADYTSYLLSGIARCRCGSPLSGNRPNRSGSHYYICLWSKRRPTHTCGCANIRGVDLDAKLEERIRYLFTAEGRSRFLDHLTADVQTRIQEVNGRIQDVCDEVEQSEARTERITKDYRNGDLPAKIFAREVEAAEVERNSLRKRLETLQEDLRSVGDVQAQQAEAQRLSESLSTWDVLEVVEKKHVLKQLVNSVTVYRPRDAEAIVEVEWRTTRIPEIAGLNQVWSTDQ